MSLETSEGGSRIKRYEPAPADQEVAPRDEEAAAHIVAHVTQHIGSVDTVIHELVSEAVHIDILVVKPTSAKPFWTLVTSGMSDLPIKSGCCESGVFAELVVCLPADWPMSEEVWQKDEAAYWPIRLLKQTARMPHLYRTLLRIDDTVPNGDPPVPFHESTRLCCSFLWVAAHAAPEFYEFDIRPDKHVFFLGLVFLDRDEMNLKLKLGAEFLGEMMDRAGVTELVVPQRRSMAPNFARWNKYDFNFLPTAVHPAYLKGSFWKFILRYPKDAKMLLKGPASWNFIRAAWRQAEVLPAVVTSLSPPRVAILANLSRGENPLFHVQITPQPLKAQDISRLAVGVRIPALGLFCPQDPETQESEEAWHDFWPLLPNAFASDRSEIDRLMNELTEEDWEKLDRGLRQVPTPTTSGLYPVNLSEEQSTSPPPAATGGLRLAGQRTITSWKIIGGDTKEYGPYTTDQLQAWLAEGRINRATLTKPADGGNWKPLAEYSELK